MGVEIPTTKSTLNEIAQFLIKANDHIDIFHIIPKELIPLFYDKDLISVVNCLEKIPNEQENEFDPATIEGRIESLNRSRLIEEQKVDDKNPYREYETTHFGRQYKAKEIVLVDKKTKQPVARKITYTPKVPVKGLEVAVTPNYTFELIGYDPQTKNNISIGVTSYQYGDKHLEVYSSFERATGLASLYVGFPQFTDYGNRDGSSFGFKTRAKKLLLGKR